jgi:hypothetical protein
LARYRQRIEVPRGPDLVLDLVGDLTLERIPLIHR